MLFERLVRVQIVGKAQLRAQLFRVDEGLLVVSALVDAHFDADAVHVAAILGHHVAGMVGGLGVGEVVVDLVVIHGVVPRNDAVVRVGVLMDEGIVRRGVRAGGEVVGFVNDEIFDLARLTGARTAALGDEVGVNGDAVYVAEVRVLLRRFRERALGEHAAHKGKQHEHGDGDHSGIYGAFSLLSAVKSGSFQALSLSNPVL